MIQTPIAIVGMGKSGESAERLLLHRGFKRSEVLSFDQKAKAQFNDPALLMSEGKPRTLVVSPGVPLKSDWIQEAIKAGVQITSEINLACESLTTEKVIGITGSLGKSTTVSVLGAGLLAFDPNGFVGGNLGTPFCEYAYGVEMGKPRAQWIVLELSSYQLENSEALKLNQAAITFLSANHMERYDSLEHYYQTKWNILKHDSGHLFINKNGGDLLAYAEKKPEFSLCIVCSKEDANLKEYRLESSELLGSHNQDNIALAAQIALHCQWPTSAIYAMKSFKGLEHRLENVGVFHGVHFINDSKATALDSVSTAAQVAYEALPSGGRLILLLGGKDKNLPWEDLKPLAKFKNTVFVFFGDCREIAKAKTQLPGDTYPKLGDALEATFQLAKSGDVVLLSPGGTSLDEFKGFEDRGRFFKEKIQSFLKGSKA